ncbi:four helix bundle protein [Thiohalocapsa halophila]|uniref:Four helix bundle protein n=1 Tax=Thiohalocapsa halophila TaxID=69359 RepID=A0ABS1CEW5_9GAMM|nr:four helix bundle protein [Thiohalocapsa halophila]MBK1630456.1 four helix bundle protein [Thiohalocapsa halophila]
MAGVRRFEEWIAWQRARALTAEIYRITAVGPFQRDFALRDQVRRAAVSIMSNIAEGHERYSRTEFKRFLSIARGSAAEVRSQLYVALDLSYVDAATFSRLIQECVEISRLIGRMYATVDQQQPAPPT